MSDPNCDGYQRGLASMAYKFFDKKIQWKWYLNFMNFINRFLENLRDKKFIHLLETISGS